MAIDFIQMPDPILSYVFFQARDNNVVDNALSQRAKRSYYIDDANAGANFFGNTLSAYLRGSRTARILAYFVVFGCIWFRVPFVSTATSTINVRGTG